MTPDQWRKVGELFHEALDRPVGERTAWAESADGDPEIRHELLSLLENDRAVAGGFVAHHVKSAVLSLFERQAAEAREQRVGSYKLLRELGRGGMGTVYLAERDDEQYETKVAIKLVRPGMDTDIILSRFRRERQTLAQLQHPNIARLLDGGTTDDGRPYIVMEYIEGLPITEYCQGRNIAEKLRLFLDVCSAVEYAHQHFVVHRDIKPGNILVSEQGTAKLLDFGICKLLHSEAVSHETLSGTLRMMTPDYASPEQVRGEPVTIASDIYSLAGVLYELVTGFKPHRFEKFTPQEMERAICDHDVIRPSLVPDKALARKLKGDLDNILLLALQKEPQRRYASVERFSEDLRRYLAHQPIKARPDTVRYRVRKFARRQSKMLVAGGAVAACLVGGALLAWHEATVARANMMEARRLANVFVFDVHDAVRDLPGSTRARQLIVETGLKFLDGLAKNSRRDWDLKSELATAYERIGDVQGNVMGANLGNTQAALESYGKSVALLDELVLHDPGNQKAQLDRLRVEQRIGAVYLYTQDGVHALETFRGALKTGEELAARYPDDEELAVRVAEMYAATGHALWLAQEFTASYEENAKAVELASKRAETHPDDRALRLTLASAWSDMGMDQTRLGKLNEALVLYRKALPVLEELTKLEPANAAYQRVLLFTYGHLGDVLGNVRWKNLGDPAGALAAYRQMLGVAQHLHQTDPANQQAAADYASALARVAALAPLPERVAMYEQSIAVLREIEQVNPQNVMNRWDLSHTYLLLGETHEERSDRAGTLAAYAESTRMAEDLLAGGMASPAGDLVTVHGRLGLNAAAAGNREEALRRARRALEISDAAGPLAKGRTASAQRYLTPRGWSAMGLIYAALAAKSRSAEDRAEAAQWLQKALAGWREIHNDSAFTPPQLREMQQVEKALEAIRK